MKHLGHSSTASLVPSWEARIIGVTLGTGSCTSLHFGGGLYLWMHSHIPYHYPPISFAQTCWGVSRDLGIPWEISEWYGCGHLADDAICWVQTLTPAIFIFFFLPVLPAAGGCWAQRPPRAPRNSRTTGQWTVIKLMCICSHLTG